MLGQLCRYLRAAGYDTVFDTSGLPDRELLRLYKEEGRHFLTQDQLIVEHKAALGVAFVLPKVELDQMAVIVGKHFHFDWSSNAFTRCLEDNAQLLPADGVALQWVPDDARIVNEPLKHCPVCNRVYWQGSHYKRIRSRLLKWQKMESI